MPIGFLKLIIIQSPPRSACFERLNNSLNGSQTGNHHWRRVRLEEQPRRKS